MYIRTQYARLWFYVFRQALSTFGHMERVLIHTLTFACMLNPCCNVVSYFAKVFLRVLCGCSIWAGIGPDPTALVMSLLKMGLLPGLPLSKHHLSYSCKVTREAQWAAVSRSSAVIWLIKALWIDRYEFIKLSGQWLTPSTCTKNLLYKQNRKKCPWESKRYQSEKCCLSVSTPTCCFTHSHSLNRNLMYRPEIPPLLTLWGDFCR